VLPYSLIIDVVVAVLLIVTIVYAISLNKRLGMLRRDRGELEKLAQKFTLSTERANESLGQLHATAEVLQHQIDTAQALRDDLAFLLERGEKAADRLEDTIRASRSGEAIGDKDDILPSMKTESHPDRSDVQKSTEQSKHKSRQAPLGVASQDQNGGNNLEKPAKSESEYTPSDAERELLKAIRSTN
jgi:hypothetical protein